jgi:hypothetical protein
MNTEYGSGSTAMHERTSFSMGSEQEIDAARDIVEYLKEYARQKPEVAALWCFGIGFVLGWKLKPW